VNVLLHGILARRRWPGGLAAWTFSALMLAPTSMAVWMGADLAPDRYTYLSGLGFATLARGAALTVIRGHARELQARGRSTEAEALLAEARALESGRPARR
jgi:hypothetical protein